MGRTDVPVPYATMTAIRDAAIARYGATGPATVGGDASFTHSRWTSPGGAMDPYAPQYAVPCKPPNAFTWGEEIMAFFRAHPRK